jgi:YVTN family beta-propeller protein
MTGPLIATRLKRWLPTVLVPLVVLTACTRAPTASSNPTSGSSTTAATTVTPVPDAGVPRLDPSLAQLPPRVYVPNGLSNTVSVIDPTTRRFVSTFPTSREPQHVVPSYDLRRLWVLDNRGNDVVPIDPFTSSPGLPIHVRDPYNMYFTPDGVSAIVVAEKRRELDFRDPETMALTASLSVPECDGINHLDYSGDFHYVIATCEFNGNLVKIDWAARRVIATLQLPRHGSIPAMPQDIRVARDGRTFFVAEMMAGGLMVVDGDTFRVTGFIPTGLGTHGITPNREGNLLYVANRGTAGVTGAPHGQGSVSVVDVASGTVTAQWTIPGGGSPDMGNLSTDGHELWLSGRFDSEVYVFDCVRGGLAARISVQSGPHGLTYWPQPGRFSLGHTGNMR